MVSADDRAVKARQILLFAHHSEENSRKIPKNVVAKCIELLPDFKQDDIDKALIAGAYETEVPPKWSTSARSLPQVLHHFLKAPQHEATGGEGEEHEGQGEVDGAQGYEDQVRDPNQHAVRGASVGSLTARHHQTRSGAKVTVNAKTGADQPLLEHAQDGQNRHQDRHEQGRQRSDLQGPIGDNKSPGGGSSPSSRHHDDDDDDDDDDDEQSQEALSIIMRGGMGMLVMLPAMTVTGSFAIDNDEIIKRPGNKSEWRCAAEKLQVMLNMINRNLVDDGLWEEDDDDDDESAVNQWEAEQEVDQLLTRDSRVTKMPSMPSGASAAPSGPRHIRHGSALISFSDDGSVGRRQSDASAVAPAPAAADAPTTPLFLTNRLSLLRDAPPSRQATVEDDNEEDYFDQPPPRVQTYRQPQQEQPHIVEQQSHQPARHSPAATTFSPMVRGQQHKQPPISSPLAAPQVPGGGIGSGGGFFNFAPRPADSSSPFPSSGASGFSRPLFRPQPRSSMSSVLGVGEGGGPSGHDSSPVSRLSSAVDVDDADAASTTWLGRLGGGGPRGNKDGGESSSGAANVVRETDRKGKGKKEVLWKSRR